MRDVLLLLALPASGKSEIRRFLDHVGAEGRAPAGMGRPVHLDDYPYVHLMRRISEEQASAGEDPVFFESGDLPFRDRREWSTLTLLLDEDAAAVLDEQVGAPATDPAALLARIDRVRRRTGMTSGLASTAAAGAVATEAAAIGEGVMAARSRWEPGETMLIVEFARGGPDGSGMPLPEPLGYGHALALLSPALLGRAAILYVWVTPEESRRRNQERAQPGRDGDASILHHGVPELVMAEDYGCDDMEWLLGTAHRTGTIDIPTTDGLISIPTARLDNRDDLTSHLRGEPDEWDPKATAELQQRLTEALRGLGLGK